MGAHDDRMPLLEQFALLGRTAIAALPFWYMGARGAVGELVKREEATTMLMTISGSTYDDCAATVNEYAANEPYPCLLYTSPSPRD